ncbi:Bug family tripartite tricarboxylate transporter substrate binding protein [Advenella mimigardefordensis]|uniref:Putative Bug-like extracytoplasmic solute binding receptor, TTT family n=1 Tax=Advenella mimigardefordensis (strain DSM 17166 / LMG 22922 / DPN7) TaxID=1247726 RepID=W0PH85_ADVMD|nr:tripartite tricarboxylate transporter substrate binding protein [Advenella mimigardefordensis]AHG65871.1 putative Bug-like extracytoplasmic solute binding receptor, TTT family [Advenella mimigardefordensis DPN7]
MTLHSLMVTPRITPRRGLALASLAACAIAGAANAAGYPERPVTLIVPFPPAGTTDLIARHVAQALEKELGQTIVVENRAGAGGNVGMGALARAKADGYTIGMGTVGTQTINQYLYKDMPFDPQKDFAPIALAGTTPNVIAVNANADIKSLGDLIAKARAATDKKLSYASPGVGSSVHLTGAYLEDAAGISMLHVPFKGVSGSMPALIGGQVDVLMDNLPSTLSQVKDGSKVRAVAVTGAQRDPAIPDVPTVAESGLPGFDVNAWFALYAPAGTPPEAMKTLVVAAEKALASNDLKQKLQQTSTRPGTIFGADLTAFEAKERERWHKLIQDKHIQSK